MAFLTHGPRHTQKVTVGWCLLACPPLGPIMGPAAPASYWGYAGKLLTRQSCAVLTPQIAPKGVKREGEKREGERERRREGERERRERERKDGPGG